MVITPVIPALGGGGRSFKIILSYLMSLGLAWATYETLSQNNRASQVAQWVKVLAAKPEDLSLIPGTPMVEGRGLPKLVP